MCLCVLVNVTEAYIVRLIFYGLKENELTVRVWFGWPLYY